MERLKVDSIPRMKPVCDKREKRCEDSEDTDEELTSKKAPDI